MAEVKKRRRHVPSDSTRAQVKVLTAERLPLAAIARQVGATVRQLERHYARELRDGPDDIRANFTMRFYQRALAGDPVAERMVFNRLGRPRARSGQDSDGALARDGFSGRHPPGTYLNVDGSLRRDAKGRQIVERRAWRMELGEAPMMAGMQGRAEEKGEEGPADYYRRNDDEVARWVAERTGRDGVVRLRPGDK